MSRKPNFTAKEKNQVKASLLGVLEKMPVVEAACSKVGISRMTFYRWKQDDPDFATDTEKAIQLSRASVNDLAESKLIKKVQEEHMPAIRFWLQHNHEGYNRREKTNQEKPETGFDIQIVDTEGNNIERIISGKNGAKVILPDNGRPDMSRINRLQTKKNKPEPFYKSKAGRLHLRNTS